MRFSFCSVFLFCKNIAFVKYQQLPKKHEPKPPLKGEGDHRRWWRGSWWRGKYKLIFCLKLNELYMTAKIGRYAPSFAK